MARFGTGINASLGAINYAPYMQGAVAGSQGLAQGIASLGQVAGTSISNYFKRKEEEDRLNKDVDALKTISNNPGTKATFEQLNIFKPDGSFDEATAKALLRERGLAGTVTLANALKDLERQAKTETTNKKAIEYSSLLEVGGGKLPSPYSNDFANKSFTPEEKALGKDIYIKQATAQANLTKAQRELQMGSEAPTAEMRNADAIIAGEIAAGMLPRDPVAIAGRRAELIGAGGREPGSAYDNAGTYVLRKDQTNPITAVKNRKTGQIGTINKNGQFEVLDSGTYMPIITSEANPFLNEESFKKLSDQLLEQENGIKSVNRFLKNTENISPAGIQRGLDKLSMNVKSIMGLKESDLSESERALGLAGAQQQRLLGALRTTILGPGVLTEIDAQRILDAVGGDVSALTTNVGLMQELVGEILQEKINAYEQNLDIYNTQVAGRYGRAGFKQRPKIQAFIPNSGNVLQSGNQPQILSVRPVGK